MTNVKELLERTGFQLFMMAVFLGSALGWDSGLFDRFIIGYSTEAIEMNRDILIFCAIIGSIFVAMWAIYEAVQWSKDRDVNETTGIKLMD